MVNLRRRLAVCLGLSTVLIAARCSVGGDASKESSRIKFSTAVGAGFRLDQKVAVQDLAEWTKLPHPFGSARQGEIAAWLRRRIDTLGLKVVDEPFVATVPNPALSGGSGPVATTLQRSGTNLYATPPNLAAAPCAIVLATHIDTKDVLGLNYLGANDSGSSSVLLLQLLAYLHRPHNAKQRSCAVIGAFFDGEEAVLANWNDGELLAPAKVIDHTYGSRYAAQRLQPCDTKTSTASTLMCLTKELGGVKLRALILLDMVGSPGLRLSRDQNSSPELVDLLQQQAVAIGQPDRLSASAVAIEDDHLPFRQRGVPAVDLIDFEHLSIWHQAGDDASSIDMGSLQVAGQLAAGLVTAL
jgi:hypothetical protein